MITLPFKMLHKVEQTFRQYPPDGLVLILTTDEGEKGLAVYLDDSIPKGEFLWPVKSLSALNENDFLNHGSLATGFDALGLAFPHLQTHGVWFYSIHWLFEASGHSSFYAQNGRKLARWLVESEKPSQRRDEKLVALMLPWWFQNHPPSQDTVAMAISPQDFPAYLDENAVPHWLEANDLAAWNNPQYWILTFREAQPLLPERVNWIEWRFLLYNTGHRIFLQRSLQALARAIWKKSQCKEQETLQKSAWALALEIWLPAKSANDLLAIQLDTDFERFLTDGQCRIVCRSPVLPVTELEHIAWNDLFNGKVDSRGTWFALEPICGHIKAILHTEILPLEPVWLNSGQWVSLAQALLGLTDDLINGEIGRNLLIPHQELVRLAQRGLFLVTFSDPWDPAWGGRYSISLHGGYQILDDVLLLAEQQTEKRKQLFNLLRQWYAAYLEETLSSRYLNELQNASKSLYALDPDLPDSISPILKAISAFSNGGGEMAFSVPKRRVVDFLQTILTEDMPLVSDGFVNAIKIWEQNHCLVEEIEHAHGKPSLTKLESLLKDYRRLWHHLYALPHEVTLLRYFVDRDISRLERFRNALRGEVFLQVRLLTDQVILGEWTNLIVEVRNLGERQANRLQVHLQTSNSASLEIEGGSRQDIGDLPARSDWQRWEWRALVKDNPGELIIHCQFEQEDTKREEKFSSPFTILHQSSKEQRLRGGNLFQAGVAVFGEKFYGRRNEMKSIFDFLLGNTVQPVLLRGPRRIGKTSILEQISYLMDGEGRLQYGLGYSREDEARIRRFRPVKVSLSSVHDEKDVPGWYFDLFYKMADIVGEKIDQSRWWDDFERDPHGTFSRLSQEHLLSRYPEVYWLILLDEWDAERHVKELGGKLRALMQSASFVQLRWVFTSTWILDAVTSHFDSPFYNQLDKIELTSMPWEDARKMVVDISKRMNVEWTGETLVKLLDQTASRPYLIQLSGQRVIKLLKEGESPSNLVTMKMLNNVLNEIERGRTSPFDYLWREEAASSKKSQDDPSWLERLVLLVLEEKNCPLESAEIVQHLREQFNRRGWMFPYENLRDEIVEGLNRLEKIFDVIELIDGRYDISIPLAKIWFQQTVQQLEDPWEFAWERLEQEYRSKRPLKKEVT